MSKEKDLDLTKNPPKKGFLKNIFNKYAEQKKILSSLEKNKINNLLFYTDVENVILILEYGIRNIKAQNLKSSEEYTVWTYLENENSIGLETDSSTRAHFWKWAANNNIDVNNIAVIGLKPDVIAENSTKDWSKDESTNIIYIYETITPKAIDWIMIKNKSVLKRIKTFVEANEINVDVYFGEQGNINKGDIK